MSPRSQDRFSAVPDGRRWCPYCNGCGSSLEDAERYTRCAGTGLVVDEAGTL